MTAAYSYIRFSSGRQANGDSLRRQLEATEAYCQRHKLDLDASLRLRDLGVSGYMGNNVRNGALAGFLEAVRLGKIPRGSVLVLESVDRLSRDQVADALTLFIDILRHSINIVTLTPERYYTMESINDLAGILEPIVYMSRAYEESATKSERLKASWSQRRKRVREGSLGVVSKSKVPFWLKVVDGRFEVVEENARMVRQVFDWLIDGLGYSLIARKLAECGFITSRGNAWSPQSVYQCVKSRAMIGEYQPRITVDGKKAPEGDVILDYFPVVVSREKYYAALAACASRKDRGRGRRSKSTRNIFAGLLYDSVSGQPLYYCVKRDYRQSRNWESRKLAPKDHVTGVNYHAGTPILYDQFESAFLRYIQEVKASELLPPKDGGTANRQAELSGTLVELGHKIGAVTKRVKEGKGDIAPFLDLLAELGIAREAAREELERLRVAETNHQTDRVGDVQQVARMLESATEEEAEMLRLKLRQYLRGLVKRIEVATSPAGDGPGNKLRYDLLVFVYFQGSRDRSTVRRYRTNQDGEYNPKQTAKSELRLPKNSTRPKAPSPE